MTQFPTIAAAGKLIADKQLSPVELTRQCLDRVKKLDPALHSFLLVTEDRALADARAAEARMMAGTLKSPLDGILQAAGKQRPHRGLRRRRQMGRGGRRADGQARHA
jgi:Asp-tRNA(Asn)/Glu-tRNA(Gln) amidotransferase A subunit family amidase